MNAKKASRTRCCGINDARQFLKRAESHLEAIDLLQDDLPDSAANLAVSVAINASDAACCARIGKHNRGPDHKAAVDLLATVVPGGKELAKDLKRVLDKKDDAEYRQIPLSSSDAKKVISWSRRLVMKAREAVDRS